MKMNNETFHILSYRISFKLNDISCSNSMISARISWSIAIFPCLIGLSCNSITFHRMPTCQFNDNLFRFLLSCSLKFLSPLALSPRSSSLALILLIARVYSFRNGISDNSFVSAASFVNKKILLKYHFDINVLSIELNC